MNISSPRAFSIRTLLVATLALSSPLAMAAEELPGHQAGSQYTAIWQQKAARWQFTPAEGEALTITADSRCASTGSLPTGVWLLTRDSDGHAQLTAPSAVALPAGHSGQVRLVDCATAADGKATVAAPGLLLDLLAATVGAVRIDD